jgi:hypothetical protein
MKLNLTEGLVVHNYGEMCSLLGEKFEEGNSKRRQIKEWLRRFDFERKGHKYLIKEIYPKQKPKESTSPDIRLIEKILLHELSTSEERRFTKNRLFHILGMVNVFYPNSATQMMERSEDKFACLPEEIARDISDIPDWQVNNFYQRCNQKLRETLFSALSSMKRRSILDFLEEKIIVYRTKEGKTKTRIADSEDIKKIARVEKSALEEMGHEKKPFQMKELQKFYNRVKILLFNLYDWDGVYRNIKFIFDSDNVQGNISASVDVKKIKIALNESVIKIINAHAQKEWDKNCAQYKEAFESLFPWYKKMPLYLGYDNRIRKLIRFDYPPDYVDIQIKLAGIFIKLKQ